MTKASKRLVKGFGLTEAVLAVIMVALIVGVVGYIKHVNNTATSTYDQASQSASSVVAGAGKKLVSDQTCMLGSSVGQLANIGSGALTFCLPKGWNLEAAGNSFYSALEQAPVYDASKPATITRRIGGSDSWPIVSLSYEAKAAFTEGTATSLQKYTQITAPSLKNSTGLTIAAYYHFDRTSDDTVADVAGSFPAGSKEYLYVITMPSSTGASTVLEVNYNALPENANVLPLVQQLVSSVSMPAGMKM